MIKRATATGPDEALALRLAVANLLRLAAADLADARLLLRKASPRNAAILVKQAITHIIVAVAASEHGWPLAEWNTGLHAVPEANALQPDLVAIDALASEMTVPAVQADGRLSHALDSKRISQALRSAASTLEAITKAVDIDIAGTGPARRGRSDPTRSCTG